MMLTLAFLNLGFGEMALVAIIALLLYGSDLPTVARTWGKVYQDFRRNLHGIRNDLTDVIYAEPDSPRKLQYYPEFQHVTDVPAADDNKGSPAAETATETAVVAAPSEETQTVAADQIVRQDAHGAA